MGNGYLPAASLQLRGSAAAAGHGVEWSKNEQEWQAKYFPEKRKKCGRDGSELRLYNRQLAGDLF
jgi:hypothetical protein